jgi:hypothetical protein
MIMGTMELGEDVISVQYRMVTSNQIAGELGALVSNIPLIPEISQKLAELAFGIKIGALRDMVREKAAAITEAPYQCDKLEELNSGAEKLLAQMNQPIPPLVNNFLGVRASIDKVPEGQLSPEGAEGMVAIHVDKPEMFVGMAQMFVPDLAELDLTPGSAPVRVPESLVKFPDMVAHAAISDDAIGLSVGEGLEAALPDYLDQSAKGDGTILAVDYDSAAYAEFTDRAAEQISADVEVQNASISAIAEAAQTAYKAMAGRNKIVLRVESDGIAIDSRMTFK